MAARPSIEAVERRDLMALVVAPISAVEDVPFSGRIATFSQGDVAGSLADFVPGVTWGDGTTSSPPDVAVVAGGPDVYHVMAGKTYAAFGAFPVSVTVRGLGGSTATSTSTAVVADAPLTPVGASLATTAGQLLTGTVGSFLDQDATSGPDDFSIVIDWGDGQTSLGSAVLDADSAPSRRFAVTGAHAYGSPGTYQVEFRVVRIASGRAVSGVSSLTAVEPALSIQGLTAAASASGPPTAVTLASFTDADPGSEAGDFPATIQWGTGLQTTAGAVAGSSGSYTIAGTFAYPGPGAYNPVVTMTRTSSGQSRSATASVVVAAPPLSATGGSITAAVGTRFRGVVASFVAASPDARQDDFTATIKWDDSAGSLTPGTIVPNASGGFDVEGSCSYDSVGPRTAVVTVSRKASAGSPAPVSAAASTAVAVLPSLTASPGPAVTATEGRAFTGPLMSLVVLPAAGSVGDFRATIDRGDGTTSLGTLTPATSPGADGKPVVAPGAFTVRGSHVYAAPGDYTARVVATQLATGQGRRVRFGSGSMDSRGASTRSARPAPAPTSPSPARRSRS